MPTTYSTGNKTKQTILTVSRQLFYSKGFLATTYDDISQTANVNRALIPYHFTSKELLGQAVYQQITTEFQENLEQYLDMEELSPDFVAVIRILASYRLYENPQYASFVEQLQEQSKSSFFSSEYERRLLEALSKKSKAGREVPVSILCQLSIGIRTEILHMICTGSSDINTLAELYLHLLMEYAGYSKAKTTELIEAAGQLLDLFSLELTQDFTTVITYR